MKRFLCVLSALILCFSIGFSSAQQSDSSQVHVKMCAYEDIGDFTPFNVKSDLQYEATRFIFDTLYYINEDGKATEMLAGGIQISQDYREYRVSLKDGSKWHDGSAVTADDVLYTFETAKNTDWYKARLSSLEAVNVQGNSIIFTLKHSDTVFMKEAIAYVPIVPKAYYEKGEFVSIGSGAYKVNKGENVYTLTAVDSYFTSINADKITIDILGGSDECAKGIIEGKYVTSFGSLNVDSYKQFNKDRQEDINVYGLSSKILVVNNKKPYLNNTAFRNAVASAIDFERIVKDVYGEEADAGSPGFFSSRLGFANTNERYSFDKARAQQLLADAGYTATQGAVTDSQGNALNLTLKVENEQDRVIAEIIKANLGEIGIQVSVQHGDSKGVGDYDFAILPLSNGYQECESGILWMLNETGYKSEGVNKAVDTYLNAIVPEERYNRLIELQAEVAKELPFITLCYPRQLSAYAYGQYDTFAYKEGVGIYSHISFMPNRKSIAKAANDGVTQDTTYNGINMTAAAFIVASLAAAFAIFWIVNRNKENKKRE